MGRVDARVILNRTDSTEPRRRGRLLRRNVKRFRGGLVFKAHGLFYHPTPDSRVIKKKAEKEGRLTGSCPRRRGSTRPPGTCCSRVHFLGLRVEGFGFRIFFFVIEFSDTHVYEPEIRARLGTTSHSL